MTFRIGTFNCRDFFDDAVPHVIGQLDREGFGIWARRRARTLFQRKLEAVATVVARMDADVVAFQEIEGAHVLDALRDLLPQHGYLPAVAGVADARGIACGVLSRFPITAVETHGAGELAFPSFAEGDPRPFTSRLSSRRGVLEVDLTLPDGSALAVMVLHLKSARPIPKLDEAGDPIAEEGHYAAAEGAARSLVARMAEALFVRSRIDARLMRDSRAQLAVAGDFNDGPDSLVVRSIAGTVADPPRGRNTDLDAVTALESGVLHHCAKTIPQAARFTILHRGEAQQIDHVLVSRSLWRRFKTARALNEELRDSGVEGREDVSSDHAALVAEFA
ncbi:MAG: endonuclease/exonuclease/phosphatase family protein [Polyangiales bacterium]